MDTQWTYIWIYGQTTEVLVQCFEFTYVVIFILFCHSRHMKHCRTQQPHFQRLVALAGVWLKAEESETSVT